MSEHKPSAEDVLSDLQILGVLQERLEQHISHSRGVWQELPQWADQLYPIWLEQQEASQRLKELLKLLETRMEGERRERLEQLVHLDELRESVQLVRAAVHLWESPEALELLRRLERIARRLRVKIPTASGPAYETDFAAWAQHQALMSTWASGRIWIGSISGRSLRRLAEVNIASLKVVLRS